MPEPCLCIALNPEPQDAALNFLEALPTKYRVKPEARHVNYVVEAFSLQGNLADARGLVDASGPGVGAVMLALLTVY